MTGGRGKSTKKDKKQKNGGPLQTSISPAGTDVEDASAAAFDGAALSGSELREAVSHEGSDHEEEERWEAPFSAAHVQRLEAEIERLSTRLHTARFTATRAATTTPDGNKKPHWRPDSIRIFSVRRTSHDETRRDSPPTLHSVCLAGIVFLRSPPGPHGATDDDPG